MAERELEKLKCYACNGKMCQMCYPCNEEICQIDSCQFRAWVKDYKGDFGKSYISIGDEPLDVSWHYFDPDQSYYLGDDRSFFTDLETFLNKQEENMKKRFAER